MRILILPAHGKGSIITLLKIMGRRIRILQFVNSEVRAGVEEHILSILKGLDPSQFEPIFACPPALIKAFNGELKGFKVLPIKFNGYMDILERKRFFYLLKEIKPDIVHSHMFISSFFASPLAKLAGAKVVETSHGREAWRKKGIKGAFLVDRLIGRFVDRIIAVSSSTATYLIKEKGLPEEKIVIIHNGRELEEFDPFKDFSPTKREFGLEGREPVISVIGRLEEQKGHRYLLEALPALVTSFPSLKVLIVGDGSLKGELMDQCRTLNLTGHVVFTGFRKDIVNILGVSDFVVLPSLWEGLPLIAIEASAMARPLVATGVDGTPEVVRDGKTGILVPPKDVRALKEGIVKLASNKALRREMGLKAREWVIENFSIKAQIERTALLYKELMD